jgi:RNA polymerase sigma factor (sigma-70 family)
MKNPLAEDYKYDESDLEVIELAKNGDKKALEKIIKDNQNYIYNIALRMVFNPEEAKDITQEVLIKVITSLSTFEAKSKLRTWIYRIAVNHILNFKKTSGEKMHANSFSIYGNLIDETPDYELPDNSSYSVDMKIIVEEVKYSCMFGMLLCLDREQRMVYVLGAMFGVTDKTGAEIMNISRDNFRQKLSRARKDMYSFMNNKCGLVNKNNPCRCEKKTKALLDVGYVNPQSLRFNVNYYNTIEKEVGKKLNEFINLSEEVCEDLFRNQPFHISPDFAAYFKDLINSGKFKDIFNYN